MKEVSCRVLDSFFKQAAKQGFDPEILARSLPYPLEHLRNRGERIEWSVFVGFMKNASTLWDKDQLEQMGRGFMQSPLLRPFAAVARVLFTAADFYRWVSDKEKGAGNMMFTCVSSSFAQVGSNQYRIVVNLDAGYAPCEEFFIVTKGAFAEMPLVLGDKAAQVSMTSMASGVHYDITLSPPRTWIALIRRWFLRFSAPSVARELKGAHEELLQRYAQLDAARVVLDEQARQLLTSHSISQIVHGNLDLDKTMQAVTKAMVEHAGFSSVVLRLSADLEGRRVERTETHGSAAPSGQEISSTLETRGHKIGELICHVGGATDISRMQSLLEFVLPAVTMALDDSLTFTAVTDYRDNLERKVTLRTQELSEANDKLEKNYAELKLAQEARDRIFANVNHELRTPLSLILLGVEVIKLREATLAPRSLEDLDAIETAGRRLLRLIDELLALAAGQEGKLQLSFSRTDVAHILRQIVTSWQPAAEKFKLKLLYSGDAQAWADVDPSALERIVTNLVSNAIKFTPASGMITVRLDCTDNCTITVRDTGIGLTEEFKSRVFGRFERGEEAVNATNRSSGLGLALVKTLAEAHQGTVSVQSEFGHGTCFVVTLPRHQMQTSEANKAFSLSLNASDFGLRIAAGGPVHHDDMVLVECEGVAKATALVAEDDPALRDAIVEVLRRDYRVLTAADGVQALELAKQYLPDLLVTDVGMPRMDGFELSRRFRELPNNRLAPVILLTAYGALKDRLDGFESGAVDYIMKPFDPEELRARARTQLGVRDLALRFQQAEKVATLSMLSSGLAHEIRNPANGIVNSVPLLKELLANDTLADREAVEQLIKVLSDSAQQIRYLCKSLLGAGTRGDLQFHPEPFSQIAKRAVMMLQPKETVEVSVSHDSEVDVNCAGPLISQVLCNLLQNAVFACGEAGQVRLTSRAEGDWLRVEVSDTGPGIRPELRERIFDAFFTTKGPDAGTGLGLSTARQIVVQHGGTLELINTTQGGATFSMRLPLSQASVIQPSSQQHASLLHRRN